MGSYVKRFFSAPISQISISIFLVWAAASRVTAPNTLNEIENAFLISVGCGVVVAYARDAALAHMTRIPTQADWLGVGIWWAWVSVVLGRTYTFTGRILDIDLDDWFNTHMITFQIMVGIWAGVCHLTAPEAIEGWKPSKVYVTLGIRTAVAAFVLLIGFAARLWLRHHLTAVPIGPVLS